MMDYNFDSRAVLQSLLRWRVHLLIILVMTAIAAVIFSGPRFITPMFKSYAIVYPDNLAAYSEESTTEQMIQIMQSQDIVDSVVVRFQLARHYDINPNYRYFRTELMRQYHENVSINKTSYEAVKVEVLDHDPDTAKLMVDAILDLFNKKVRRLQKQKFSELADAYAGQMKRQQHAMDSIKNRLRELGTKEGVFEYDYQSQQIMKAYLGTVDGNPTNINSKEAKRLAKNMGRYGGELVQLVNLLEEEAASYVKVKISFEKEYRHVVSNVTYTNVVTYPYVADKKTYPVRWLIVLVSLIAVFAFSIFVISIVERIKTSDS
jgi:uncharacterized protein involved in exopolysaccharide biosynthesis